MIECYFVWFFWDICVDYIDVILVYVLFDFIEVGNEFGLWFESDYFFFWFYCFLYLICKSVFVCVNVNDGIVGVNIFFDVCDFILFNVVFEMLCVVEIFVD